jgi:hypothetical protein
VAQCAGRNAPPVSNVCKIEFIAVVGVVHVQKIGSNCSDGVNAAPRHVNNNVAFFKTYGHSRNRNNADEFEFSGKPCRRNGRDRLRQKRVVKQEHLGAALVVQQLKLGSLHT